MDDNSYFNLSTTATSPKQQLPVIRVPPSKVTSPQRRVNQQRRTVSIILHRRESRSVPGARRWSVFLFGFPFIDIF